MANKEVAAIRRALSDRMNNVEKTPQKRSLGTIVLFPTAFQCPWADRLCRGEICDDGVTINTDDGDTFESVHHWVQAEQRREMMAIVKLSQQERMREEKEEEGQKFAMPGTSVPFGFSKGNHNNSINNNNTNKNNNNKKDHLDVKKALAAFHDILSRSEWSQDDDEGAQQQQQQQHETAGNLYDDDDEDDLYNFDDDENENDMGYHTFKSTFTPVVRVM